MSGIFAGTRIEMLLEVFGLSSGFTAYWLARNWFDVTKLERGETLKDGSVLEKEEKAGEAVGLYVIENKFTPPIYMNVGTIAGVGIPVGGGFETDYKPVFHSFRAEGGVKRGLKVLDLAGDAQTTYINDVNTLENFLNGHQITLADIPVTFPLQVRKKQLPHVWYSSKWHVGGSNKRAVATYIAKARRWAPREFVWASALVATLSIWMLAADWDNYKKGYSYRGSNADVNAFLKSKVGW